MITPSGNSLHAQHRLPQLHQPDMAAVAFLPLDCIIRGSLRCPSWIATLKMWTGETRPIDKRLEKIMAAAIMDKIKFAHTNLLVGSGGSPFLAPVSQCSAPVSAAVTAPAAFLKRCSFRWSPGLLLPPELCGTIPNPLLRAKEILQRQIQKTMRRQVYTSKPGPWYMQPLGLLQWGFLSAVF
jgi:hypothetical protein